jgi:hypothetical protein
MVIEYNFLKISWIYTTIQYKNDTIINVIDVIIYTDKFSYDYQIKTIYRY